MFQIARALGVERLSQAVEVDFAEEFPQLREEYGDRAVLRALHFYHEDKLVECRAKALRNHDMDSFVALTRASGISSGMYLQNVSVSGSPEQPAMIAIAISDELLFQSGCCRIHGGGFGGTVQAFVPQDKVDELIFAMDYVFGKGSCQVYQVDHEGARAWKL
jgi:galactokinase